MPFTREQINDVKLIIKETVGELLADDKFISLIVGRLEKKLGIKEQQQKIQILNTEIDLLKKKNTQLECEMDDLRQHTKRKSLRIHGIKETTNENVVTNTLSVLKDKMQIDVQEDSFDHCFRIGKNRNDKRTILVTIKDPKIRLQILQKRKYLKGSGLMITEDMTTKRFELYKLSMEKFGKERVWFYGGEIRVKLDETKHVIKSQTDLDNLLGNHSLQ